MPENYCILIVEDDIDTSKMLSDYFEALNYEVTTAIWGEDALKAVEERLPDLVLLDIRLPDIDGYEVCRRLRSHRRTERIPIIFLTERWERTDRLTGLELGAVDYVTKPFDFQELRLRVRNALLRTSLETMVNPVTGLPTDPIIDNQLSVLLQQKKWAVLFVGIRGLRKFSNKYGFVAGDDVLRAIALIVKDIAREVCKEDLFIGHSGESDLVLISDPAKIDRLRDRIADRLEEAMDYFYPFKDQALRPEEHPRISLAIGVVSAEDGPFQTPVEIKTTVLQTAGTL